MKIRKQKYLGWTMAGWPGSSLMWGNRRLKTRVAWALACKQHNNTLIHMLIYCRLKSKSKIKTKKERSVDVY
jgi:hypothetical protein